MSEMYPSSVSVPLHWKIRPVQHCCDCLVGFAFSSDEFLHEPVGVPLLRGDNITTGYLRWGERARYWDHRNQAYSRYLLAAGDVVIGMDGSKVGRNYAFLTDADLPLLLVQRVARLRAKPNVLPKFLFYSVCNSRFHAHVDLVRTDPAIPHVTAKDIGRFPICLPPPVEQQAIVAFLDRKTAEIDAIIRAKERMTDLLREKRQAVVSQAVTRGLNPSVKLKNSGVDWLGLVPAHWAVERLKFRFRHIEQGWSPQCENRQADPGEWGVLKVGCMNSGVYDESENKALPGTLEPFPELEVKPGQVLMSRSNTVELVGMVGIVHQTQGRILLCDKLYRIDFLQNVLLPEYAVYLLRSQVARLQIERDASGASPSMKNISTETVGNLTLSFPPLDEQRLILAYIQGEWDRIDGTIKTITDQVARLREYRQTLISAAVTGNLPIWQEVVP